MPDEKLSGHLTRLNELSPDARARVEDTLKTTIESELSRGAASNLAGKEFSRGIIYSRSRGRMSVGEHPEIIKDLQGMDEATFGKFTDRLKSLKDIKG